MAPSSGTDSSGPARSSLRSSIFHPLGHNASANAPQLSHLSSLSHPRRRVLQVSLALLQELHTKLTMKRMRGIWASTLYYCSIFVGYVIGYMM